MQKQLPLFLTPHSLSPKTAFGVLTNHFLADFPEYIHAYWNSPELGNFGRHSIRLESLVFSRLSLCKRDPPPPIVRRLASLGLSWWDGNCLRADRRQWIRDHLSHRVSVVYVAPSETRECERTRDILLALEKPFVLHLWDLLDEKQSESPGFRWLLEHATHVLCVSEAMVRHLAPIRPDAQILCFSRRPPAGRAQPPQSAALRIMLTGYCRPYVSGLKVLNDALRLLKAAGQPVELGYIGSKKAARQWSHCFEQEVKATGFVPSGEEMDRVLATGHVGFLPGPLDPPASSPRSRFSIPSRILDFLATGLPLIATVHRDSSTAYYLRQLGLERCMFDQTPERLAKRIISLRNPGIWRAYSEMSQSSFIASCRPKSNLRWLMRSE